jgi:hypothetical protein
MLDANQAVEAFKLFSKSFLNIYSKVQGKKRVCLLHLENPNYPILRNYLILFVSVHRSNEIIQWKGVRSVNSEGDCCTALVAVTRLFFSLHCIALNRWHPLPTRMYECELKCHIVANVRWRCQNKEFEEIISYNILSQGSVNKSFTVYFASSVTGSHTLALISAV